ncbi:MAG: hypothetical protein COW03_09985 [Cytophagales bacterium CG12_big_fil_rev_8_21_14_0_65_40_12]|nr:MAG: hypothetical protein COW03_09985 [Cytophagales bacterium CG12_big_fil_rev_8_21_14_0_65_40_12]PIW03753.1 MAG: hypothetical protein COW40_13035 [Cytophagales bacterium CG17_big_fil_post_rev_8_21_14_2_50_40_13]
MSLLKKLNIVKGDNTIAAEIFESLAPAFNIHKYEKPSDYVRFYWKKYLESRDRLLDNEQQKRGVNGKIFEYILATLLINEGIYPIFLGAKVAFVPNINYDLMLYSTEKGPICLSAKTSFRERYKQADLEAVALKFVHRRSLSFLLTLSEEDANSVNGKQKIGDILGLDKAICATTPDFDDLIVRLKSFNLIDSPKFDVISATQVINEEVVKKAFS